MALNIASYIDHTVLNPDAKEKDIQVACEEAIRYRFKGLCMYTKFLPFAVKLLYDSAVLPIAVVDFPKGSASPKEKASLAKKAIEFGAQELDMVLDVEALKQKNYAKVFDGILAVVKAAQKVPVKVIIETCLLSHEEKVIACALSKAAKAAFVKTSTGFSTAGAIEEDIALMRQIVGKDMGVKASGGIRSFEKAKKMIEAGADRIGTSSSVKIMEEASNQD